MPGKKKMTILVTNDDGIDAPGLKLLEAAAKRLGRVVVVAPPAEQSGTGSAHSLMGRFVAERCGKNRFELYVKNSIHTEGSRPFFVTALATPIDCVRYGIHRFKPDLALVGVNHGANTGINAMCSGTVCAAAMAGKLGVPVMAISMHAPDWEKTTWTPARLAELIKKLRTNFRYKDACMHVNIPPNWKRDLAIGFKRPSIGLYTAIAPNGKIKLVIPPETARILNSEVIMWPIGFVC